MKPSIRLLLALPPLVTTLQAAVPLTVNYQGTVYDSTGTAIGATAAVNRKVIFRLYDTSTAGTKLWTEEQTVTIYKGEFSVVLGNGTTATGTASTESRPALDTVFTGSTTTRYLEVMVDNGDGSITNTDTPISPRQLITTTFYAFHALVADGIASSTDLTINPPAGSGTATNYGLGWYGTGRLWNGLGVDGPVLYGNAGGALGSNASGTKNTALLWNATGQVGIGASSSFATNNKLTLQGDDTATATTAARQLIIRGQTDSNEAVYLGFDTTNNRATLQSYTSASATTGGSLLLNPSGGSIGVGTGTTAPVAKLTVEGAVSATGTGGFVFGTGGDADGGMFSPADGTLVFSTNGNERLRIDSAGKVGIGETPTNKLSVVGPTGSVSAANAVAKFGGSDTHVYLGAGDGTTGYLPYIQSYNNNGSGVWPLALQQAGGKVGIGGIKDPYVQLHLFGSAGTGAPALRTEGSLYLQDNGGGVGNGGALLFGSVNFNVAGNGGMFAGIKGYAGDASQPQQVGDLAFYTRRTGSDANLTETMRLTQGGRVGIGTSGPYNQLHLFGANGTTAPAHQNSASIYLQDSNGTNGSGGALLFGAKSSNATDNGGLFAGIKAHMTDGSQVQSLGDLAFYTRRLGTDGSLTESMRIAASGYVGIGTTAPTYPLHVRTTVSQSYNGSSGVTTSRSSTSPQIGNPDEFGANGSYANASVTWPTSIWAEGVVAGSAFYAMSDLRIKDIVARSSAQGDLDLIKQLQVTDYRLKDRIGSGTALHKGFIAQEVRALIPEAVSPSRNYLPDIYLPATENLHDAAQKRLTITLAKPHALAVGDWVRVYGDETPMETEVLAVLSPTAFVVASDKPVAKAFVYGRRVEDFLTVDYDRIFTTGIGAIKELDRKLTDESVKVTLLQSKMADLESKLAAAQKVVNAQEARIDALEAQDQTLEAKHAAQLAEQNAKLAVLERLISRQLDSKPPVTVQHVAPVR